MTGKTIVVALAVLSACFVVRKYVIVSVNHQLHEAARTVTCWRNNVTFGTEKQSSGKPKFSSAPLPKYDNFLQALTARADADRYIILTMVDESFSDMAINFYEASLRAYHIDNFLFVGVGRKICEILTNRSIACFYYADDSDASRPSDYSQKSFNRKVNIRDTAILEALTANFTVINSDADIAFLRNPLRHLKVND